MNFLRKIFYFAAASEYKVGDRLIIEIESGKHGALYFFGTVDKIEGKKLHVVYDDGDYDEIDVDDKDILGKTFHRDKIRKALFLKDAKKFLAGEKEEPVKEKRPDILRPEPSGDALKFAHVFLKFERKKDGNPSFYAVRITPQNVEDRRYWGNTAALNYILRLKKGSKILREINKAPAGRTVEMTPLDAKTLKQLIKETVKLVSARLIHLQGSKEIEWSSGFRRVNLPPNFKLGLETEEMDKLITNDKVIKYRYQ